MGRTVTAWTALWAVLAVLGSTILGCANGDRREPSPSAEVTRGRIERIVVATGTIEPEKEVEVRPRISGIIEAVHVEAGQMVAKDTPLAEIDRELLEAQAAEARSALKRAEVEERYAGLERQRSAALQKGGTVAAQEHERAESRHEVARAGVARDAAALEFLEVQLRHTTVVAPMAGKILDVDVEAGDAVSSVTAVTGGTRLLTIAADDVLHLEGLVDENEISRVAVDQPARLRTEAFEGEIFTGRVRKIKPVGEREQNVTYFEVEVVVEDPTAARLRPKMSADADIIAEVIDDALLVPETALLYEGDEVFVDVPTGPEPEDVERRTVTIGIVGTDTVQILSGLEVGDRVRLK